MGPVLFPSRVFELQNEIQNNVNEPVWKCLICRRRAVICSGSTGSVTVVAVRKSHTILKCCSVFSSMPDREKAIDSACQRLTDILKRRDKKEAVLASFQAGVAKFRTVQAAHASTGLDNGEYTGEEAEGEEDALIARNVAPLFCLCLALSDVQLRNTFL